MEFCVCVLQAVVSATVAASEALNQVSKPGLPLLRAMVMALLGSSPLVSCLWFQMHFWLMVDSQRHGELLNIRQIHSCVSGARAREIIVTLVMSPSSHPFLQLECLGKYGLHFSYD